MLSRIKQGTDVLQIFEIHYISSKDSKLPSASEEAHVYTTLL